MKKSADSNALSPRKLAMRRDTVRVLRQLPPRELQGAQSGVSATNCYGSTIPPLTAQCTPQ